MQKDFIKLNWFQLKSMGGFPLTSMGVETDAEGALYKETKLVNLGFLYIITEIFHYSHI